MSAIFEKDLDIFFDDFAVTTIINGETFQSIFNTPTDSVNFDNVAVEGDHPWIRCKTSDLTAAAAKRRDSITVDSISYKVAKIRAEGAGTSVVWLETV